MEREKYFEVLTFVVNLKDPRADPGNNHVLSDLVALPLRGLICCADAWANVERFAVVPEGWDGQYLGPPHGIPSDDTFGRIFQRLDVKSFKECIGKWVEHPQICLKGRTVAIDRKTVRIPDDNPKVLRALHLVSAWASQMNFCPALARSA